MTCHIEEPLYTIFFSTAAHGSGFVEAIRDAMRLDRVHRHTPPGPLVIYGPPKMPCAGEVILFVTAGILRAAELLQFRPARRGSKLDGAIALPHDAIVLFAHLGGVGTAT